MRHILLPLSALTVLVLLAFVHTSPSTIPFTEDMGLTMLVANEGLSGNAPLLGPPSHRGGRHLGPIYYYLSSALLWIARGNLFLVSVLFSVLHIIGLILAAGVVALLFPAVKHLVAAVTILAGTTPLYMSVIRAPWHSHMLLPAGALFLYAAARLRQRGLAEVPLFFLSATILLQIHYSSAPLLLAVGVVTLAPFALQGRVTLLALSRIALSPSTLLALALWVPVVWFEISYGANVVPTLLGSGEVTEKAGPYEALFHLSHLVRLGVPIGALPPKIGFVLLGIGILVAIGKLRDNQMLVWVFLCGVVSALLYLATLTFLSKPLHSYFLYALLPLLLASVGIGVGCLLESWPRSGVCGKLPLSVAFGLLAVGLSSSVIQQVVSDPTRRVYPFHSLLHASEVAAAIRERDGSTPVGLVTASASKLMHGAIMAHLSRESIRDVQYFETLTEMAHGVPNRSRLDVKYLLACPRIYSPEIRGLESGALQGWRHDSSFLFHGCTTCGNCLFRRYEREEATSNE